MSVPSPRLSIVVAAVSGPAYLEECLAGLERQRDVRSSEVIVVEAAASKALDPLRGKFPHVRFLSVDAAPSVARLRAAGIRASRGAIVAITEDHCIPEPTWCESILAAHAQHDAAAAIGGAVDNGATARLVDWAVFFCEYAGYASPVRAGRTADLPGPNVSYKRGALDRLGAFIADEYWETFVHRRLAGMGEQLWCEPSMQVLHTMHFTFTGFVVERYYYGRAFAGTRRASLRGAARLLRALASPAVFPYLLLRISRHVAGRRALWGRFALCLPMICCFTLSAAAGECAGYGFGPGKSMLRFR